MDQQVPARLDHQPHHVAAATAVWRGRHRRGAGVPDRPAARAREGGPFAHSDDDRHHGAQRDHAPPPLRRAASPGALTPLPQPLPGPRLTPGHGRPVIHDRDRRPRGGAEPDFQSEAARRADGTAHRTAARYGYLRKAYVSPAAAVNVAQIPVEGSCAGLGHRSGPPDQLGMRILDTGEPPDRVVIAFLIPGRAMWAACARPAFLPSPLASRLPSGSPLTSACLAA